MRTASLFALTALGVACAPVEETALDASTPGAHDAGTVATGTCTPGLPVLTGAARNARDLGGIPVVDGRTACGAIYRGAYLTSLMGDGCAALSALGVRTVIDLRMPTEGGGAPIPCDGAPRVVAAPLPIPYALSPTNYLEALDTTASVRAVFDTLGDATAYPIYVNCVYGRDRTGVVAALVLGVLGASRAEILADYQRTSDAGLATRPDSLEAVLDALDDRGGAEAHLTAIGVPPEALDHLRARAVQR